MAVALDRQRFARHLLLAEIGEAGQVRLCAAQARLPAGADARAAEVARDYLERAGARVISESESVTESGSATESESVSVSLPSPSAVRALAGRAALDEAAAALAGALAAVEAIKSVLGLQPSAALPSGLVLARENEP